MFQAQKPYHGVPKRNAQQHSLLNQGGTQRKVKPSQNIGKQRAMTKPIVVDESSSSSSESEAEERPVKAAHEEDYQPFEAPMDDDDDDGKPTR